jgi:hypothetical protein
MNFCRNSKLISTILTFGTVVPSECPISLNVERIRHANVAECHHEMTTRNIIIDRKIRINYFRNSVFQ